MHATTQRRTGTLVHTNAEHTLIDTHTHSQYPTGTAPTCSPRHSPGEHAPSHAAPWPTVQVREGTDRCSSRLLLEQVPPQHSSGFRAHSSTSGPKEGDGRCKDADTGGYDVALRASPCAPTRRPVTPAEARRAWTHWAPMTQGEELEQEEQQQSHGLGSWRL